jgi:hypothetical protein
MSEMQKSINTSPIKRPYSKLQPLPNSIITPIETPVFRLGEWEKVAGGIPKHLRIQQHRARHLSSSLLHPLLAQESTVNQDIAARVTFRQDITQQVQRRLLTGRALHKSEEAIITQSVSPTWYLKHKVILEPDRWVLLHLTVLISKLRLTLEVPAP